MSDPKIQALTEEENILKFTISNLDTSVANSIRRIILSEIPLFVFKAFSTKDNESETIINIISNTCKLHNEIIKQRLGCIPIHIDDEDFHIKIHY